MEATSQPTLVNGIFIVPECQKILSGSNPMDYAPRAGAFLVNDEETLWYGAGSGDDIVKATNDIFLFESPQPY